MDPIKDNEVFPWDEVITDGEYLNSESDNQVFLGLQTAGNQEDDLFLPNNSLLTTKVGDTINITNQKGVIKDFEIVGIYESGFALGDTQVFINKNLNQEYIEGVIKDFEIVGIYESGFALGDTQVFINKNLNQEYIEGVNKEYLNIRLWSQEMIDEFIEEFELEFANSEPDLKIQSWDNISGFFDIFNESFLQIRIIIYALGIILSILIIFIINYIRIQNQIREIGMSQALGLGKTVIHLGYLFTNLTYYLVGLIFSLVILYFIIIPVSRSNPLIFPVGEVSLELELVEIIPNLLIILLSITATSLLSSYFMLKKDIPKLLWN